jgi:hypothetical protein
MTDAQYMELMKVLREIAEYLREIADAAPSRF